MRLVETGTGAPLLLLHGAGVAGWMWRPTLDAIGGRARALMPDLPGHGTDADSPYRSHTRTVDQLAHQLEAQAAQGAVVAGFSLGAQLAILLAATRPDLVRGVLVISAQTLPLPLSRFSLSLVSISAPLARRPWFARAQARQLGVPEELVPDYLRDSAVVSRQTLVTSVAENLDFRLPSAWSAFPGTAVVLAGARERPVMLASARATGDALPGSTVQVVPECGHDIPFRRPDLVADLCLSLLGG